MIKVAADHNHELQVYITLNHMYSCKIIFSALFVIVCFSKLTFKSCISFLMGYINNLLSHANNSITIRHTPWIFACLIEECKWDVSKTHAHGCILPWVAGITACPEQDGGISCNNCSGSVDVTPCVVFHVQ